MSVFLDTLLKQAENYLPESRGSWITDLRAEAAHIPAGFSRMRFQWSGLFAALGHILRFRFGPQKMGQLLLTLAIIIFCLGGIYIAESIEEQSVKSAFNSLIALYALAGSLAAINLVWMKLYTVICGFSLCSVWAFLGFEIFAPPDAPIEFLRALSLEAAFIMAGLFIVGSYLGWVEEDSHA